MKNTTLKIVLGLSALILVLLSISIKVVPSGYVGFVDTLGVINENTRKPGVTFTWPLFQGLKLINVQQNAVPEEFHVQTLDNQIIHVTGTAIYNINESNAARTAITIGTDVEKIKATAFQAQLLAAVKQEVNKKNMQDAISKQGEIATNIQARLTEVLGKNGTITFDSFNLTGFKPSEEVQAAIEQKQVAEQNKLKAQTELEIAEIDAKKNELLSKSLSSLLIQDRTVSKWDGKSQVFGNTNTSVILPAAK